jgi:hypothetical protein
LKVEMSGEFCPKASLILIDISGVTPALSFSTRESATRETPMCAANAVTLMGMEAMASLMMLPG